MPGLFTPTSLKDAECAECNAGRGNEIRDVGERLRKDGWTKPWALLRNLSEPKLGFGGVLVFTWVCAARYPDICSLRIRNLK